MKSFKVYGNTVALLVRISNGDLLIVSVFGHKMNAQLFDQNTDGKIVRFFTPSLVYSQICSELLMKYKGRPLEYIRAVS